MKRKPSERTLFERWYRRNWRDTTVQELRERRTEFGYLDSATDLLYLGWRARAEQDQPGF